MGYRVPLKVCDTKGKRIIAVVSQLTKEINYIKLPYIAEVEKDKPLFAKKGKISTTYEREKHQDVLNTVTKYLEDLFLKRLSKDENNNPSKSSKSDSRGNKKKSNAKPVTES